MKCPNCGSEGCHLVEETTTHQKGFDVCSGVCGYVVLGPIGLLCGLCGMGDGHTSRKAYWVCNYCGRKFRA